MCWCFLWSVIILLRASYLDIVTTEAKGMAWFFKLWSHVRAEGCLYSLWEGIGSLPGPGFERTVQSFHLMEVFVDC